MQGHRELSSGPCQCDTTRSASDIFLCDLQWNVSGISIKTDGECVTAALIDDDDRPPTGYALKIGEERKRERPRRLCKKVFRVLTFVTPTKGNCHMRNGA